MKLGKKNIALLILACLIVAQTYVVFAEEAMSEEVVTEEKANEADEENKTNEENDDNDDNEENKTAGRTIIHSLETLTEILVAENLEIEKSKLNHEMLLLNLEQTLEDYEELQEDVENAKDLVEVREKQVEIVRDELSDLATDTLERSQALAQLNWNIQLLDAAERSYEAIIKQEARMMESLELMKLQRDQSSRKKKQEIEKIKANFKKNYFQLVLLENQKEVFQKQLENLDMLLETEKVKKNLELTTQMAIFELGKDRSKIFFNIRNLENNIEQIREKIKTDINVSVDEDLMIILTIKENITIRQFVLNDVIEDFMNNNLALETSLRVAEVKREVYEKIKEAYEEDDNEYKVAFLEIREAEINELRMRRDFEHLVKQAYFQHEQVRIDLLMQLQEKMLIEDKFEHTKMQYDLGLISELQYRASELQVKQANLNYVSAKVNYINAKINMELLVEGIN
ncbi:MAG: TolC family protein [Clostridiales bacterium]|nr:TolC family protein [Clostridiales bacterium]